MTNYRKKNVIMLYVELDLETNSYWIKFQERCQLGGGKQLFHTIFIAREILQDGKNKTK